jgi:ABC-type lipoprotein export system ATPase subunit
VRAARREAILVAMTVLPSIPGSLPQVVRLAGVTKAYQAAAQPALADVSLTVAGGEVAAIMGPPGSGKSTLLNLVAGPDRPTAGIVHVAGQRIGNLREGALDTATGQQLGRLLAELNAAGQALVLVTHDPALARRHAARTIEIVDGRVAGDEAAGTRATARAGARAGDTVRAGGSA